MKAVLIGHRGEPERWPENSLLGFQEVLRAGADYIETDVQITADGIPVLSHDLSLLKITGHDLLVTQTNYQTIRTLPAGYTERFGNKYQNLKIARLQEFAELLKQWPHAKAFIELKHASIKAFGADRVVDIVLQTLADVVAQCIFISFEIEAIVQVRARGNIPVGLVLSEWSDKNRSLAGELAPEYLFCSSSHLPPETVELWPGPWQWVVYTVNEVDAVFRYLDRGIDMIETNVISLLLTCCERD